MNCNQLAIQAKDNLFITCHRPGPLLGKHLLCLIRLVVLSMGLRWAVNLNTVAPRGVKFARRAHSKHELQEPGLLW